MASSIDSGNMEDEKKSIMSFAASYRIVTKDLKLSPSVLALDTAWTEKRFDDVLDLLQKDSVYPDSFKLDDLSDEGDQGRLKRFVIERETLHDAIRKGDLNEVKKLTSNKSTLYLNTKDESAALTAINNKKGDIYAYLKSIGACLSHTETKEMEKLSEAEINNLRENLEKYFPESKEQLILSLRSKSTPMKELDGFQKIVKGYYEELNTKIPQILQVIECDNDVKIIFDFDDDAVCFLTRASGLTLFNAKKIYIGCNREKKEEREKREENEILGTLAHELTHMAMDIVFKNNGAPYEKSDENWKEFENVAKSVKIILPENMKIDQNKKVEKEIDVMGKVFSDKKCKEKIHMELIVRVPHILLQFENGAKWLENNVPELWKFYLNKVLPKCQKFIDESYLLNPRTMVKSLNENFGEINSLKKCNVVFKNVDCLENFLNKQMLACVVAKNFKLSLCRVLQALYGKNYANSYGSFIIFKAENFLREIKDVEIAFYSEATDSLILDCQSAHEELIEFIIQEISGWERNKKIILVVDKTQERIKNFGSWERMSEEDFSLQDLDPVSQGLILKKNIIFQETEMTLREFCEREEHFKFITGNIIEKLLDDKTYFIGGKIFGVSNLEGSYAQIFQDINLVSLIKEMKTSNYVFIFSGCKNKIIEKLKLNNSEIDDVDLRKDITDKKILWTEQILDDDFRKFCQNNPLHKIYLMKMEYSKKLILQEIFNPDFYMKRKIRRTFFKTSILSNVPNETFIITGEKDEVQMYKQFSNVKILDENEAKEFLKKSEKATHWFTHAETHTRIFRTHGASFSRYQHLAKRVSIIRPNAAPSFQTKNYLLIWKCSNGSVEFIRDWVDTESPERFLIDEDALIQEIMDMKAVIFTDEPGMGKSTTLTKLCDSKSICAKNLIIRINIKDHLDFLKQIGSGCITVAKLIKVLLPLVQKSNEELAKVFLKLVLREQKNFSKSVLFAFDGFDELMDEDSRKSTICLLKFLKDETNCKIWITSRSHYKEILEKELGTFAIKFDPMDDETKKKFMKKFYEDRLNLILNKEKFENVFGKELDEDSDLWKYTEQFLKKMGSIFMFDLDVFLGTPLQLRLMLENSTENFKNWVENSAPIDFSYLGNDPSEIYQKYIDHKYTVFFNKTNLEKILQEMIKENIELIHEKLAESSFFTVPRDNKYEVLLFLIGLVKSTNGHVHFVHFTLREYYCAQFFVRYLTCDRATENENKITRLVSEFLSRILISDNYTLIRKFVNFRLRKIGIENIPRNNLALIGNLYEELMRSDQINAKNSNNDSLRIAIKENNGHILNLILSSCKSLICNCDRKDCEQRHPKPGEYVDMLTVTYYEIERNLFHHAAVTEDEQVWKTLMGMLKIMTREDVQKVMFMKDRLSKRTPLLSNVGNDNAYGLKLLLKEVEYIFEDRSDVKKLLKVKNDVGQNILSEAIVRRNHKAAEILLDEIEKIFRDDEEGLKEFLMKADDYHPSIFHKAAYCSDYPEIVCLLFQKFHNIMNPGEFLELFGKCANDACVFYEDGIEIIRPYDLKHNEREKASQKLIHFITAENKYFEILKLLYDKKESISSKRLYEIFLLEDLYNRTALQMAARYRCLDVIRLLLKMAKEKFSAAEQAEFIMYKNIRKETVFHSFFQGYNRPKDVKKQFETLNLLLDYATETLSVDQQKELFLVESSELTAFHIGIRYQNRPLLEVLLEKAKCILNDEEFRKLKSQLDDLEIEIEKQNEF